MVRHIAYNRSQNKLSQRDKFISPKLQILSPKLNPNLSNKTLLSTLTKQRDNQDVNEIVKEWSSTKWLEATPREQIFQRSKAYQAHLRGATKEGSTKDPFWVETSATEKSNSNCVSHAILIAQVFFQKLILDEIVFLAPHVINKQGEHRKQNLRKSRTKC